MLPVMAPQGICQLCRLWVWKGPWQKLSYFCLCWWSSWLHPYTSMAQTQICPLAVITDTFGFTQTFPSSAQLCSVGPRGANASTYLSQQVRNCMHAKNTNKGPESVLWFPVLVGVRITWCMFIWSTRNSREDLQIWISAFQREKAGKLWFVNPFALFLNIFPRSLVN